MLRKWLLPASKISIHLLHPLKPVQGHRVLVPFQVFTGWKVGNTHLHSSGEIGVSTFQLNWPAWLWTEAPKDNLPKDKENMHTVQRSYGWYSTRYDILTVYDYGYDVTSIPTHRAKFSSCMNWMQQLCSKSDLHEGFNVEFFFVETVVEKCILKAGVCGFVEKVKSYTFCPPQLH